ncbi:hypothetical protein L6164_010408 [Bauhinia variegata]|uniref:Uncharacterized protein n=1 Tax=Bauhinia variegata TaxID=167791 RepID=A0ACB9PQH8_BAUVA|nr:hypothetical protein L6164_010408 [Bauhinia variegata]
MNPINLPPLKPIPCPITSAGPIKDNNKGQCSNCGIKNQLLHNVQLRGVDHRVCTSCVLRLHPSSFCPLCFEFYDHPLSSTSSSSAHRFISCTKCSSLTHIKCLPSLPPHSSFVCPPCSKPGFSFFDFENSSVNSNGGGRFIDKKRALVLLCATRIASASMNKAVNMARAKADRTVREAALARSMAVEAVERFVVVDKGKRIEGSIEGSGSRNFGTKDKDKTQNVSGIKFMGKMVSLDGITGHNKLPSMLPQNVRSVTDKKNGASDSGGNRDAYLRGIGTTSVSGAANVKDKSGNDDSHEEDLELMQNGQGRIVDVSSR